MKACCSLFLAVKNGSSDTRFCVSVCVHQGVVRAVTGSVSWALPFWLGYRFLEEEGEGKKRMVGRREKRQKREKSTCQRHKSDSFPN